MTQSKYRIIFSGRLLEGFKHDQVKQSLAQLLKIPLDQAGHLIQGHRFQIKRTFSQERAEKLLQKMTARGAECTIELVDPDEEDEGLEMPVAGDRASDSLDVGNGADEPLSLDLPEQKQESGEEGLSLDLPEQVSSETERSLEPDAGQGEAEGLTLDLPEQPEPKNEQELTLDIPPQGPDKANGGSTTAGQPDPGAEADEDIVLATQEVEQQVDPAAYHAEEDSENQGTFYERSTETQASVTSTDSGKKKQTQQWMLLAGVGVLLLAIAAWQFLPGLMAPEPELTPIQQSPKVAQPAPAVPVNPEEAKTKSNVESLSRSIRVWMIQFGSGFNPSQVTLQRLQQDLQIKPQEMVDGWGTAIRYQPGEGSYQVISAGPDKRFGTSDDLVKEIQAE